MSLNPHPVLGIGLPNFNGVFGEGTGLDPKLLATIDRLDRNMEKVMERLAILEEPDPEKLEQHKSLRDAYEKYLFLEKLCGEEE